jgi:pimeloyl-ACP methyl ester carboxylesterase|tara:strand:- start:244 stop:1149 length:906 start_codon:yes stop_codon:yes gene_type:complete
MLFALLLVAPVAAQVDVDDVYDLVEHHYADNEGVRIHYVTLGEGPVVLFMHGFPNQWYDWRYQMAALADDHQVVAMSMRGYNRSDRPTGVEHYDVAHLTADAAAVIADLGVEGATIVGHDWGGIVAWSFAERFPELTDNLVIFNRPHPRSRKREMALNNEQKRRSAYIARFTTTEGDLGGMNAEQRARRWEGTVWYERYLEAYRRSDYEAMLNYYRAYYPAAPWMVDESPIVPLEVPVLEFHGLDDGAYVNESLNDTWKSMGQDLTLVTLPGVGHNSQNTGDIPFVTNMLRSWLELQQARR